VGKLLLLATSAHHAVGLVEKEYEALHSWSDANVSSDAFIEADSTRKACAFEAAVMSKRRQSVHGQ